MIPVSSALNIFKRQAIEKMKIYQRFPMLGWLNVFSKRPLRATIDMISVT